jgi:uncharacterized protein (TIGR02001 family)
MFDLPPPIPVIEIVVANEGNEKGLRETDGIQVVGTVGVRMGSVEVGTSLRNVDVGADLESKTYATVTQSVAGFDVSGTVALKALVRNADARGDNKALELEAAVSRSFGPLTATASYTYSPNDLGAIGRSHYTMGTLAYSVMPGTTVSASLGHRDRVGAPNYTAYNVGVTQTLTKNVSLDVRYHDTNRGSLGEEYGGRTLVSVGFRF